MLRQDDYVKAQLVTYAWRYTKQYGGHDAALMVMSAIANRQKAGWGSWLEVIARIPALAAETECPNKDAYPNLFDQNFIKMLQAVEQIYAGTKDYCNGGLYWCDLRKIETDWFRNKITGDLENHTRCADMNCLTFFR